jgi:hypothetical protein
MILRLLCIWLVFIHSSSSSSSSSSKKKKKKNKLLHAENSDCFGQLSRIGESSRCGRRIRSGIYEMNNSNRSGNDITPCRPDPTNKPTDSVIYKTCHNQLVSVGVFWLHTSILNAWKGCCSYFSNFVSTIITFLLISINNVNAKLDSSKNTYSS